MPRAIERLVGVQPAAVVDPRSLGELAEVMKKRGKRESCVLFGQVHVFFYVLIAPQNNRIVEMEQSWQVCHGRS